MNRLTYLFRRKADREPSPPIVREWTFSAYDTTPERALKLAEIAFIDFANDRLGMTERAAFRIADALAKYALVDTERQAAAGHAALQSEPGHD